MILERANAALFLLRWGLQMGQATAGPGEQFVPCLNEGCGLWRRSSRQRREEDEGLWKSQPHPWSLRGRLSLCPCALPVCGERLPGHV